MVQGDAVLTLISHCETLEAEHVEQGCDAADRGSR